jgi:SAM-dependent methyltransferase
MASHVTLSRLGVRQLQAKAEAIPLPDGVFDGALAAWVLQYADDPSRAIRELARVCRRTPGTRAVVVQAAPMNDLVRLYNVCARALGQPESHHGYLLDLASRVLDELGLRTLDVVHCPIPLDFRDIPTGGRASAVSSLVRRLHHAGAETEWLEPFDRAGAARHGV